MPKSFRCTLVLLFALFLSSVAHAQSSSATFLRTDSTTQGNWHGAYGADGYSVANDSQSIPSYATFSIQNQSGWTYSPQSTDVRALQTGNGVGRLAAAWYNNPSFTADVNFIDGQSHQFALYAIDWDSLGRTETVQVLDAATDAVLNTQSISGLTNGLYLVWNISGHVKINVIDTGGPNAVISGVFFGGSTAITSSTNFVRADLTTQGSWHSAYGADGYSVANDSQSIPSYATFALQSQSVWTYSPETADVRALETSSGVGRIAATWYNNPSFTFDVNFTDGQSHQLALYAMDWDSLGRSETIQVLDAATDAVLDTQSISAFTNGVYLVWNFSGHVKINVIGTAGPNAVVSGVFFGGSSTITSAASFVRSDTSAEGNWHGAYGADGYSVANDSQAIPSYATFALQNQAGWTYAPQSTDVRALQTGNGVGRVAATCYNNPSFSFDVNFTDGQSHQLALYVMDWDSRGRTETVQVIDAGTEAILDTQNLSAFTNGVYLVWNISGHVRINVIGTAGPNAVVSGVFFGGSSTISSTASFVRTDSSTQGTWHGAYGADGYSLAADAQTVPSYATFAIQNQAAWTYDPSSTDPRALQMGTGSGRIAATWYNNPSFSFDVNFTDGKSHQFALYAIDWDNLGRTETIQVLDSATRALLSTRSIASFSNGLYLVWNISGHVKINLIGAAGPNASISGVFWDPTAGSGGGTPVLQSITITPANPSIAIGAVQQFAATGSYSDGHTQNLSASAQWSSSAPQVASINAFGLASALAQGTSTISASFSGVSGSASLIVTSSAPSSPPVISGILPNTGGLGTPVTITGSAFGSIQASSIITFNGIAAKVATWNDGTITARVPGGVSPGAASVTVTATPFTSNAIQFTVTQPLFISPNRMTMHVGDSRPIQLLDEDGVPISNPAWSFDDSTIAEIVPPVNPGDPTLIQADAPGTTSLVATVGDRTGTATVTVLPADVPFPIGTIQWSIPSLGGTGSGGATGIEKTVQAVRIDDNTPDLYAEDDGAYSGNGAIRALNANGYQKWIWPATKTDAFPLLAAADNQGGAVYFASTDAPNYLQSYCYFGHLDQTGHETWQYQETNCFEDYAIAPDGTIFLVEDAFQNTNSTVVTALDPNTGQIKFTVPLPVASHSTYGYDESALDPNAPNVQYCTPGSSSSVVTNDATLATHGAMSISSDGTVYIPFTTSVSSSDAQPCDPSADPANPGYPHKVGPGDGTWSASDSLQLMVIHSDGSYAPQTLDSNSANGTGMTVNATAGFFGMGRAISDGQGGALLTTSFPQTLYHAGTSGTSKFSLPITPTEVFDGFFDDGPMLLGEDGTAYISGSDSSGAGALSAFDFGGGSSKWTAPSNSAGTILAGGSVVLRYSQPDLSNHIGIANPTGQVTPLFANPTDGSDMGPALPASDSFDPSYWTLGTWFTPLDSGLAAISGNNVFVAASERPAVGGSEKKDNAPHLPHIVNYLPSQIESNPNAKNTTDTFPCIMDSRIWNTARNYAKNPCQFAPPSDKTHTAIQTHRIKDQAIVQTFRNDLAKNLDAIAFIGHSIVWNNSTATPLNPKDEFSVGINFFYPKNPGKTSFDTASWDLLGDGYVPAILTMKGVLVPECLAPDNFCNNNPPNILNKLLPFEKNRDTVVGLGPLWDYRNQAVSVDLTPNEPDAPHKPILQVDKFGQQARILFFGACAIKPQFTQPNEIPVFLQMWDINDARFGTPETRDRAMVVPDGDSLPGGFDTNTTDLAYAAAMWEEIVNQLVVNKRTIQQAVDFANTHITSAWPNPAKQPNFIVYGNPNVSFKKPVL